LGAKDLVSQLREMQGEDIHKDDYLEDRLMGFYLEIALLERMTAYDSGSHHDRALLCLRETPLQSISMHHELVKMYGSLYDRLWGFSLSPVDHKITGGQRPHEWEGLSGLILEGPGAARLAGIETGSHLFRDSEGQLGVVKMVSVPLSSQEDPVECFLDMHRARRQWLESLEWGKGAIEDDPFGFDPVIRLYEPQGVSVDFRTGFATKGMPTERSFRRFLLSQLPLPKELKD